MKWFLRIAFAVLAIVMALGLTLNRKTPTSEMESNAFREINNIRSEKGLNELTWNEDLYESATIRCKESAILFEHTRPDGSPFYSSLINKYGYTGENMAKGQTSSEQAVQDWMNSDTHRALILDPKFKTAALACRYYNGGYYWIEHFSSNC